MDYVLGGVAALITGNVTPNRPRATKRALTPTKHQPSPNVTPKSELVDDRSIFLSPTLQKKKAIVKKSPKRIFQNPDADVTGNDLTLVSPKAEKVKKHLKDELEAESEECLKSPKNKNKAVLSSPTKSKPDIIENIQHSNESTPKKKKKNKSNIFQGSEKDYNIDQIQSDALQDSNVNANKTLKKAKKHKTQIDIKNDDEEIFAESSEPANENSEINGIQNTNKKITPEAETKSPKKKKNRKRKNKSKAAIDDEDKTEEVETPSLSNENHQENQNTLKDNKQTKKKNKKQKKNKQTEPTENFDQDNAENIEKVSDIEQENKGNVRIKKKSKKAQVNPNAITNKDSDSEHNSDDEIESENENINKEMDTYQPDSLSEDEEEKAKKPEKEQTEKQNKITDPDEVKRTLFVGNVPFSKKCKKEIKRIFNKYGQIETVRIRTVPVKDVRDTPKMAVIKNELHPERTTVNVYVKFADAASVEKALVENNTVLNDLHLRVSRSDSIGSEHDPRCSVFVGNLPFALEDEALRAKFEKCGEIESVRIIRDRKTNAGKGFGYVNFKSKDGVELALALSEEDLTIKNRILRVKRCTQHPQKQGGSKFKQGGNRFKPQGERNHKFEGKKQVGFGQENENNGAYRRVMNKRKFQENNGEGPPNKRQNTNQPRKEKKTRNEFVGITAEKKKKHKYDKGQKKKKMLSQILTK